MARFEHTWVVLVQSALVLILLTPGVWYIGCAYALATQAYVLACVMLDAGSIDTAARLNIAAAISNALLSIILWRSITNIMDVGLAAFRAGIVCAVSLTMVISSQNLAYNVSSGSSAKEETDALGVDQDTPSKGGTRPEPSAPPDPPGGLVTGYIDAGPPFDAPASVLRQRASAKTLRRKV